MEQMMDGRSESNPLLEAKLAKLWDVAEKLGHDLEKDPDNLGLLVFGSVARGRVKEGSDLDLILVTKEAGLEAEPKNVEETVVDGEMVQISKITPQQLEESVARFEDYRINQIREGKVVFDKENFIQRMKASIEGLRPSREVLEEWALDVKEKGDREENIFLANRAALWTLRIYLALKADFFKGPTTLEDQLKEHPEIQDLFLGAFGTGINYAVAGRLSDFIGEQRDQRHPYLATMRDMVTDCEEALKEGKRVSASASLLEGLAYLGLYLQEEGGYRSWEDLTERNKFFSDLVEETFSQSDTEAIFRNGLLFDKVVAGEVYREMACS